MFFQDIFFWFGIISALRSLPTLFSFVWPFFKRPVQIISKFHSDWILITGCNSGVGKFVTLTLAEQHLNIIGVGRDLKTLSEVKSLVEQRGSTFHLLQLDLSNPLSVQDIINFCKDKTIGLVILNAGYSINKPLQQFTKLDLQNLLNCLCISNALLIHHFKSSSIYAISSLSNAIILPFFTIYATSKSFLSGLSENLILSKRKIFALHPGTISGSSFFRNFHPFLQTILSSKLIWQTAEEVSRAILTTLDKVGLFYCGINGIFVLFFEWAIGEIGCFYLIYSVIWFMNKFCFRTKFNEVKKN